MKGPPLGSAREDITWSNQVASRGRKASSTRNIKPQTSNLPPTPRRATTARKGARCGAGAGSRRRNQPRPGKTVAELCLRAPRDGRPGEGQHLTPDAPHKGGRPAPPGLPLTTPRHAAPRRAYKRKGTVLGPDVRTPVPTAHGWRTRTARPEDRQPGEGERLNSAAPHNGARHPAPGTYSHHPYSAQRQLTIAHTVGPVVGPDADTNSARERRAAEPWLRAPRDGRPGEGQQLIPDPPHKGGRPPPPGGPPTSCMARRPPQRMQSKGTVLHPHARTPAPTACR